MTIIICYLPKIVGSARKKSAQITKMRKKAKKTFKKSQTFFKKGVDKGNTMCYNNMHGTEISCRCGGIGRRPGLKIP